MVTRLGLAAALLCVLGFLLYRALADPVQGQWEDRTSLPSCGELSLDQGEELRQDAPDEVDCLTAAFEAGEGAELVVTYPTVEGDPITDYYRVLPDGTTEIYTDSTQDGFGSGEWSFGTCDEPRNALDGAC